MQRPETSANWVVLVVLGVLLIIVIVTVVTYEQVGRRRDRERLPQIGRSVDIGGRTLNIYCSGAGRLPVILESGASAGFNWVAIQREIAKFTTACWYDRAGYGWRATWPPIRVQAKTTQAISMHFLGQLVFPAIPPRTHLVRRPRCSCVLLQLNA